MTRLARLARLARLPIAVIGGLALPLTGQTPASGQPPLPDGAPDAFLLVDAEDLKKHAYYLASDELGGRYTGSEGQIKAAEYIAKHFQKLGLRPLGGKKKSKGLKAYFQEYPVERTYLDPKGTSVAFGGKTYKTGFAVVISKSRKKIKASGQFVFCRTGNPKDMPKSFKRRIPVVVLASSSGGPRGNMRGNRDLTRALNVTKAAARRGAKLVVFAEFTANSNLMDVMNKRGLLPGKPSVEYKNKGSGRSLGPIPGVYLPPEKSKLLLEKLGWEVDAGGTPHQNKLGLKLKASGRVNIHVRDDKFYKAVNVCAYLKGASASSEAILYSAHMDHLGTRMDGDAFNGADDNASGSSGLLDIAEAFAKGTKPRRSVIFLSVSGEELGLWGSAYYADNPTWPLGKIVANINIDMIGRSTQLSGEMAVSATPSHQHDKFSTLVRDAARIAAKMGMTLTNGDTYYRRSDHYNFAKKGIPVVFFCDGEHEDYHQVTDHPDKLDYVKMQRVARLAYWTGYNAANAKGRPKKLGRQADWQ